MLNQVIVFGRIVKTPELKTTSSGKSVTSFSIAHSYGKDDQKVTYYFDVTAWEKTAEMVCKWFAQGSLIGVKGHLVQRKWTTQDGSNRYSVEIVADEFQFCEKKKDVAPGAEAPTVSSNSSAASAAPSPQGAPAPAAQQAMDPPRPYGAADGEELPF